MTIIPVAEFAPDEPAIPSTASDTVFNVIPLTEQSYGPMPSHQPFSNALASACQGGITASDNTGTVRVYAGDSGHLYRIPAPGTTVSDVSKTGGYSANTNPWEFTVHGQRVIATNGVDAPQVFLEGTDTKFSNLITSGVTDLKGKYCTVIKNWLFLANTTDNTFGNQPQRTQWSAINDPTNFPTPGTQLAANNLSDFQDQPGPHGAIKGIAGNLGTADGASFFERAVWRIVYTGLPDIFDFIPAEGARGLLASGGLNQNGANVAYPTEDGFYMFDGSNSVPIGKNKIDRFFYSDIQSNYLNRMSSCVDPSTGLMFWAYAGQGASNGNANRLLVYSPSLNRWTATEASSVQIEFLLRGATFGKTLEQLDAFGTLDTLPFSLDSEVWIGNRSKLAAFDVNHKYGFFDGANLAARVSTADMEGVATTQSKVQRVRPLIDTSLATVALASRDSLSQAIVYGTDQAQEVNGTCANRARGRYHRAVIKTPAGTNWNQLSGVDAEDVKPVGGAGGR